MYFHPSFLIIIHSDICSYLNLSTYLLLSFMARNLNFRPKASEELRSLTNWNLTSTMWISLEALLKPWDVCSLGNLVRYPDPKSASNAASRSLITNRLFLPQKPCEKISTCCFKLLTFGILCYAAIGNYTIYRYIESFQLSLFKLIIQS